MVIRNAEDILSDCLNDIRNYVHEIIIVDQSSTDNSLNIAKEFTQNVHVRPDSGFRDMDRQFSIDQASCPWILLLNPDEKLDMSLKSNLNELIMSGFDIFLLPISESLDNDLVRQDAGHFQPRIFKKEAITWSQTRHSQPVFHVSRAAKINDGFILRSITTTPHKDNPIVPNSSIRLTAGNAISHKSSLASYLKDLERLHPQMDDNEAVHRFLHELSLA